MTNNSASLFRLIASYPDWHDRRVATPRGAGALWQVFEGRAGVVLDTSPKVVAFFFKPGDVTPERTTK